MSSQTATAQRRTSAGIQRSRVGLRYDVPFGLFYSTSNHLRRLRNYLQALDTS